MARVFLDTSALVKLYRTEPNSHLIQACVAPDDELLICNLTLLEFDSACLAWVRHNLVTEEDARARMAAFAADLGNYGIIEITQATWQHARLLLDQFTIDEGLRSPDALQIASALQEHTRHPIDSLVTTDVVLAKVARASMLTVVP
jgi:predicted nucleic acid-binding protein